MSLIELSTMTLDGMITNVRFNKETAINYLTLTDSIVEIGCNYGYMISDTYKEMDLYKNRIKKKTEKKSDTRKKQGLGTHFNSQITFTIWPHVDTNNTYQVKLFTNGRVQIPGIGKCETDANVLLDDMLNIICNYIKAHSETLMFRPNLPINVINIMPILQNYKSITLGADDCKEDTKYYVDKKGKTQIAEPNLDLTILANIFLQYKETRQIPLILDSANFHPERYAGFLIKFSTPVLNTGSYKLDKFIEMTRLYYHDKVKKEKLKPVDVLESDCKIIKIVKMLKNAWAENNKCNKKIKKKLTTVKLFKTGKINIDHANNAEQTQIIRTIVVDTINKNWNDVVYYPNIPSTDIDEEETKEN